MAHLDLELPYYNLNASGSGGGSTFINFNIIDEEGGSGYDPDVVADAIRDAVENLAGVTVNSLTKHTEDLSSL